MKSHDIQLPDDAHTLKTLVLEWKQKYENLLEQFKLAQQRQFSSSSEKNLLQENLFDEADIPIPAEEKIPEKEDTITIESHERKKQPKRNPIPDHFPRETIEHDISDAEKTCHCGCKKTRFGESISEQLDVTPPQIKVIQHVRPKYVCKACEGQISIAAMPALLLPKSMAAPGLVAYTIISKYRDHLPLYRQEAIWQRYGIRLPRNSLCGWLMKTAEICEPLMPLLQNHILSSAYVQADETPVQVLKEKSQSNQKKSYMWLYRGGMPGKKATYFDYQETRAALNAIHFLSNYKGYLQTDGYTGYDWVNADKAIIHLGCWAHARRPFAELVKLAKKTGKSHEVLAMIRKLYAIEDTARNENYTDEQRFILREEKSKPILDKIKVWLEKNVSSTPPKGKLGKGIQYMLGRWDELTNYLKDGRLEIDNNLIENDVRPFAVGKKNWLFAGSPRGAKAGAIFYSLIKTAEANGVEPYTYLRYLLEKIPHCKCDEEYQALLPWNIPSEDLKDASAC